LAPRPALLTYAHFGPDPETRQIVNYLLIVRGSLSGGVRRRLPPLPGGLDLAAAPAEEVAVASFEAGQGGAVADSALQEDGVVVFDLAGRAPLRVFRGQEGLLRRQSPLMHRWKCSLKRRTWR